jgi:hypothetical protein
MVVPRQGRGERRIRSDTAAGCGRGTILQLRNVGNEEVVLFIYGAPPETGKSELFDPVS